MPTTEPWPAGLALLAQEVAAWETAGQLAGQKQFLLFRQCVPGPAPANQLAGPEHCFQQQLATGHLS